MKLKANFTKKAILNKNGLNHLLIEVEPPEPKRKEGNNKPVLILIALDRSGSMNEKIYSDANESSSKMDYAIDATIKFMNLLSEKDLFGVISFDHSVFVDQPLTHIHEDNRQEITKNLLGITPRGATDLSAAILQAKKLITKELTDQYNCKILLLSDGEANRGIRDVDGLSTLAFDCMKEGITVTALGVGLQYNSKLMDAIATSGGGLLYHIDDLGKLETIFEEELKLSASIAAKQVKIMLKIPSLIEIMNNMNDYKQEVHGDYIEVYLGDIQSKRKVLFEIKNNLVDTDISFNIQVVYKDEADEEMSVIKEKVLKVITDKSVLDKLKTNEEVAKYVVAIMKNKMITEAAVSFERNDHITMQNAFSTSIDSLNHLSTQYGLIDSDEINKSIQEFKTISVNYSSEGMSVAEAKASYATSRSATRN